MTISELLKRAAECIVADDLDGAADLAMQAGRLDWNTSKLVCSVEIVGECPAVKSFLLSYVIDGWNAACADAGYTHTTAIYN